MGVITIASLKNLHHKKIILADVDETICESCSKISPEMARQINTMVQAGYVFAFISGTPAGELQRMISSSLQQEHHLLGNNGTCYVKFSKGNIHPIYDYPLTETEKKDIFAAFEQLIKQENLVSLTTREDQLQDRGSQVTLSILGRNAPKALKAQYDPEGQIRANFIKMMYQHLDSKKYDLKIGGTTSIDATRQGQDKAWGMKQFLAHNHYSLSEVLFIGDKIYPNGNDYEVSRYVDSIAVNNPGDTLRELKQIFPGCH